jgi:signal transduction histidine kinase
MKQKNEKTTTGSKKWTVILVGIIVSFCVIAVAVLASWMLHNYTRDLLIDNLRERLLSISITQASNISFRDVQQLQTESDWQKPEWQRVVGQMKKTKDENSDIVFMYIFRKLDNDSTQMEFVADAGSLNPYANLDNNPNNNVDANGDGKIDPEGADKLQWPGQPYDEAIDIPEAFQAYRGALTAEELYSDSYGEVLTGYAPITNDNGNVVAILATDIKAGDFVKITRQISTPFGILVAFLILTILVLALVLIYMLQNETQAKNKIGLLADNLKKVNDQLKILNKQKTEFVSLASHQLRGPLTAINGYVEMIHAGEYGKITSDTKEALSKVKLASRDLSILVGDYLDVTRIELGKMKYNKGVMPFNTIVDQVITEMTPVIEKASMRLVVKHTKDELLVDVDRNKLKQVMINLVDNAVKYGGEGTVTISAEKAEKNKVRFSVSDEGSGIAKEILPTLFHKFTRAPGAQHANSSGIGLGLFVAKKILDAHKGKIWAESEGVGRGSSFLFEIDLSNKKS